MHLTRQVSKAQRHEHPGGMSIPALALTPVRVGTGTGAGATTGAVRQSGHRHHKLCENTDGRQECLEGGRFMARHGLEVPPFLLFPGPGSRIGPIRGRI
jgi:hypothetical protein